MLYSFLIYQYNIDAIIILLGTFIIYGAFVATEFFGIHKKIQGLVIFHFIIQVLLSILNGIAIVLLWISAAILFPKWKREMNAILIILLVTSIPLAALFAFLVFRIVMLKKVLFYLKTEEPSTVTMDTFKDLPPAYIDVV